MTVGAWSGLLKKEFKLGRGFVLIALLAMFAYIGFAFYSSLKVEHGGVLVGFASMLVMAHILYLPLYVGLSLRHERQTMHIWLHNPASGSRLLGAKWLNGLLALCISLFVACLFTLYAGYIHDQVIQQLPLTSKDVIFIGLSIVFHIILFSAFLAILVILFMVSDLVLKTRVGKLRGIIYVLIILFGPRVWSIVEGTNIYAFLTRWGAIALPEILEFSNGVVYLGMYVFHLVLALCLFYISAYLVDKKAEV